MATLLQNDAKATDAVLAAQAKCQRVRYDVEDALRTGDASALAAVRNRIGADCLHFAIANTRQEVAGIGFDRRSALRGLPSASQRMDTPLTV
ncbi:MAG TPA: hypothetical protein VFB38_05415 [Chthonomonadaceae bacterium]|nr:hypothetical protein [Chthonomonadaceae bacterium]